MNILYVLHKDPDVFLGGVEHHTLDLARALSGGGAKVYILYPSSKHLVLKSIDGAGAGGAGKVKFKGSFMDAMALAEPAVEESLREILERYSIDVVHFQHLLGFPLSTIQAAKAAGAGVVVSVHDYFLWCPSFKLMSPLGGNGVSFCYFEKDSEKCARCLGMLSGKTVKGHDVQRRRDFTKELLILADSVVFPTEYVKDAIYSLYGPLGDRTAVIGHGTGAGRGRGERGGSPVGGGTGTLNVAYLGAFTYEKGAESFIGLIRKVSASQSRPKVRFFIIGELGSHVPDDLLRSGAVKVVGPYRRDGLAWILSREGIDVAVLFSLWPETYSYTLSEAVINGLPVIAADLGALRERISKLGVGYLVPYEDPVQRSAWALNDLAEYPELLGHFRRRCREATRELEDIGGMAKNYLSLYESIK